MAASLDEIVVESSDFLQFKFSVGKCSDDGSALVAPKSAVAKKYFLFSIILQ